MIAERACACWARLPDPATRCRHGVEMGGSGRNRSKHSEECDMGLTRWMLYVGWWKAAPTTGLFSLGDDLGQLCHTGGNTLLWCLHENSPVVTTASLLLYSRDYKDKIQGPLIMLVVPNHT